MTIHGIKITDEQIAACEKRMKDREFTTFHITIALESLGVPPRVAPSRVLGPLACPAMRAADRLIQKHRQLGNIEQVKRGVWRWKAKVGDAGWGNL